MEECWENWPSHSMEVNSSLEKAMNYVKYLEERVRELEKQNKKTSEETDTESSCESNFDECYGRPNESVAEVKARVLDKQVLIIIHCEKQKGIINKIFAQLEILHLSVLSSSVLPFGHSSIDITIIAQIGDESNMTVNGLVKTLRLALFND